MYESVQKMLMRHEGFRATPYLDTEGNLTFAYGRNISGYGITKEEAEYLGIPDHILKNPESLKISESAAQYLLLNNIKEIDESLKTFSWFSSLNDARKDAIIDIVFNIGYSAFSKFKKTISFLERGLYLYAAKELLNSKYSQQLPKRSQEISSMIGFGRYLTPQELSKIWDYQHPKQSIFPITSIQWGN